MRLFSSGLNKRQKIIAGLVISAVVLVVGAVIYLNSAIKAPTLVASYDIGEIGESQLVPVGEKTGETYTFLIAGRDKVGLNTDSMMVVSFNTTDYTINILSIPRDTMSAGTTRYNKKINSAYAIGGSANPDQLKKEVEAIIGFPVDRYAVINLQAFIDIVDAVGGVTMDIPQRMKYSDPTQDLYIDFQPGIQTLDGQAAMEYYRFRQGTGGYATGDLGRIEAQSLFLEAFASAVLNISIIPKIPTILDAVFSNIDTDLTVGEIAWLAGEAINVDMESGFQTMMLPGWSKTVDGLSYFLVYEKDWLEMLNEFFNPTAGEITSANINVLDFYSVSASNSSSSSSTTTTEPEPEVDTNLETENAPDVNTETAPDTEGSSGTDDLVEDSADNSVESTPSEPVTPDNDASAGDNSSSSDSSSNDDVWVDSVMPDGV